MSEQKHTQEPWVIGSPPPNGEQTIGDSKGLMVAVATTGHGVSSEDNARRIVACVNACAGIPTDDLDLCPHGGLFHLAAHANQLVEQLDELTADRDRYKMKMIVNAERSHAYELDNASLRKQRDELLAALVAERDLRILGQSEECGQIHWESIRDMRRETYAKTDAAISSAKDHA